jgi:tetratricopeptide (TPR) repeat protein
MRTLGTILVGISSLVSMCLVGCGMSARDYYQKGVREMNVYDCASDSSFKQAAAMEFEDEGNWYPVYMMSAGLSRIYCGNYEGALKAFQTIDQFVVRKSEQGAGTKAAEFLKTSSKRTYELTDREETLLHFYMGLASYELGRYDDALVELKKVDYIAEGTYSRLPLASLMRGMIYLKLGESDNALVAFRKVIEVNPKLPAGYTLAILASQGASTKNYLKKALLDSCGIQFVEPKPEEKTVLVVVEMTHWNNDEYVYRTQYDERNSRAFVLDAVDPDFDFSKFTAKVVKDVASSLARDAASRATFGLSGLFFGGGGSDERSWATLPSMYLADVVILSKSQVAASVLRNDEGKIKGSRNFVIADEVDIVPVRF